MGFMFIPCVVFMGVRILFRPFLTSSAVEGLICLSAIIHTKRLVVTFSMICFMKEILITWNTWLFQFVSQSIRRRARLAWQ